MVKRIPCKSCKEPMSFNADFCPNCGYNPQKDRRERQNNKWGILCLIIITVFLLIGPQKITDFFTALLIQVFGS